MPLLVRLRQRPQRGQPGGDPLEPPTSSRPEGAAAASGGSETFDYLSDLYFAGQAEDRGRWRLAFLFAAVLHVVLLIVAFPQLRPKTLEPRGPQKVYVVQQVRFRPPPPRAQQQPPKPKSRKIPIPDPTPDDPEPILREEVQADIDFPEIDADVFGIPDAPPSRGPGIPSGVLAVGGEVLAPVKVYGPRPTYTEEARQARIQGAVILQAIIDEEGKVADVTVLKGLKMGLSESAIETVRTWEYEPATRRGEPVPVFLNLVITFSLQ